MKDRLTELHKKAFEHLLATEQEFSHENYADYLLANGVVAPPCKVGDSVYVIDSEDESCPPCVLSVMVTAIGYDIGGFWITMCLPSGFNMSPHCGERCFGKTVFLTKKEAVQALKERES